MDDYKERMYLLADAHENLRDKILEVSAPQARSIMLNPITEIYLDGEDLEALRERMNVQFDNDMRERNRTAYIKSINELTEEQLERLRMDIWNALQKELSDVICQEAYIPYYKPGAFEPSPDFESTIINTRDFENQLYVMADKYNDQVFIAEKVERVEKNYRLQKEIEAAEKLLGHAVSIEFKQPEPVMKINAPDDFVEDDVSWIRKRMKHCTNPMERKQLEKRLNMIFKRRKGKKR